MIPFFLIDRPNAVKILSRAIRPSTRKPLGVMTHAMVSPALRRQLAESFASHTLSAGVTTYLMADSGAFIEQVQPLTEEELFGVYEEMGASFGLINDVLGNRAKTLQNARRAMQLYRRSRHRFRLVGVAQGQSVSDYVRCFKELLLDGYKYIAIGGLLRKKPRSVRFVQVGQERLMYEVIATIAAEFKPTWLFVLGAYHPRRHKRLTALGVWGSDYKGWLFRYPSVQDAFLALAKLREGGVEWPKAIERDLERATALVKSYRYASRRERRASMALLGRLHDRLASNWLQTIAGTLTTHRPLGRHTWRDVIETFRSSLATRRQIALARHARNIWRASDITNNAPL